MFDRSLTTRLLRKLIWIVAAASLFMQPADASAQNRRGGRRLPVDLAARHAVSTLMSGPAAGVKAAAFTALAAGHRDIISCDMGGTSFDVGVIRDGRPALTADKEMGYGLPVRVPMIDIHTIGAGGGSIARVNSAGILQVGPESAGADPGSICYGRGGEEPLRAGDAVGFPANDANGH